MEHDMSSGAEARTYYGEQTDINILPEQWGTLPAITNGLNPTTNLTESELATDNRVQDLGMVTSGEITGDISTELMFGVYDDWLEAAFWNNFSVNADGDRELTIGDTRKFFAVTKDLTATTNYVFRGVHVNTFSLDITAEDIVKISFGLMGLGYEARKSGTFAVNPANALTGDKASGLSIGDILIDGSVVNTCIESFNFELDNKAELQRCIGANKMYGGNILAITAGATGSMTLAYGETAFDLLERQRTGDVLSVEMPINFPNGKKYILRLPSVQISGDLPSPSPKDIVTADVTFTAGRVSPVLIKVGG